MIEALAAPVHAFVSIREIEALDFDVEVLQRSRTSPVVVCFGAPWSSPSRAVLATLEALAQEAFKRVCFLQINFDRAPGIARTMLPVERRIIVIGPDGRQVADYPISENFAGAVTTADDSWTGYRIAARYFSTRCLAFEGHLAFGLL